MELKDILAVGLTAEDFDTLMKGIEAIPKKEKAEELLKDMAHVMVAGLVSKTQMDIQLKKMDDKRKTYNSLDDGLSDDLTILKSKLILLRRLLTGNEAIKAAKDILNTPH